MVRFNQNQAAAALGVDRTTVARWADQGMPHTEATGPGREVEICPGVLVCWGIWVGLRKGPLADVRASPPEAVALGRLAMEDQLPRTGSDVAAVAQAVGELLEPFGISATAAHAATGWALAVLRERTK